MKKILLFLSIALPFLSTAQVTVIPLNDVASVLSISGNARTRLWYDPALNTLTYCGKGLGNPGMEYTYSNNGGLLWSTGSPIDSVKGREYQGVIYNPPGNITPSNSFATFFANRLDSSLPVYETATTPYAGSPYAYHKTGYSASALNAPACMQAIKSTGHTWVEIADTNYTDTIYLFKGIYNSGINDFTYSLINLPAPVDVSNRKLFAGTTMAWNDNGMVGYVVLLGNTTYTSLNDTTYYPIIYKTADGGVTWNLITNSGNMNLNGVNTLLAGSAFSYTTAKECDAVVDMNDNLHLITPIGAADSAFHMFDSTGYWGLFDIYTTNGGLNWQAQLLAKPGMYIGNFGNAVGPNIQIREGVRPHASRTWTGDKIVFSWAETDPLLFQGVDNTAPNIHVRGLNLNTGLWTAATDLTSATDADALCTFADAAYYLMSSANNDCLPLTIVNLVDINSTGIACQVNYIDGLCIYHTDYTVTGNPVTLGPTSVPALSSPGLSLTIFPNPARNQFSVLGLRFTDGATLEIFNTLGEKIYSAVFNSKQETVNCKLFPPGLYFVCVSGEGVSASTKFVKE